MRFPLAGNLRVNETVTSFIKERRIPHALLISGDKGSGKHTLANFIACAAVCSEEDRPCFKCRNCHLTQINSNPDVVTVAPEEGKKNLTVDRIRVLRNEAFISSQVADCRVFIIDNADTMNSNAQNALLKVLEEPPGAVKFILIAQTASSLLDTVISRCSVLPLTNPDKETSAEYLKNTTDFPESEIISALDSCNCNIGSALDILNGKTGSNAKIKADEFINALLNQNELEMLKITFLFEKNRIEAEKFIKELKLSAANKLRENIGSRRKSKLLFRLYEFLNGYEKNLKTNISLSLLFSALVSRCIN